MKKIDLKDWDLFSERANSYNYISKDGKWLLKGSSARKTLVLEDLERDIAMSRTAIAMGVMTPKPGEIVEMPDGTPGIVSEYIKDKKSYSRYISEHPEDMEFIMREFARQSKRFHSIKADKNNLLSFEEQMVNSLNNSPLYTEDEKKIILDKLERLGKADTVLHGDFQPSNIIIKGGEAKYAAENSYFIDLGMMTYGNPLYDIGFLWFVAHKSNERVYDRVFHADQETVLKMWEMFAAEYFETSNMKAIDELLRPYALAGCNQMLAVMPTTGFIKYNREEILNCCKEK